MNENLHIKGDLEIEKTGINLNDLADKGTILWSGDRTATTFAPQNVTLSDSIANYKTIYIIYSNYRDFQAVASSYSINVQSYVQGIKDYYVFGGFFYSANMYLGVRDLHLRSDTTIDFQNATSLKPVNNTDAFNYQVRNDWLIPEIIIGIK